MAITSRHTASWAFLMRGICLRSRVRKLDEGLLAAFSVVDQRQ